MNWSQVRKSYKSPQTQLNTAQRFSTTCLNTPPKQDKQRIYQSNQTKVGDKIQNSLTSRQCPYHFNKPTHICLTCRKSICLRCAITYCQQHDIHTQEDVLPVLKNELITFQVEPKIEEISIKLSQSTERQQYFQRKILKLIEAIEGHFQYISEMLTKKKLQIIQYYDDQFQKYLSQYRKYDEQLKQKLSYLRCVQTQCKLGEHQYGTIEEIDTVEKEIRKSVNTQNPSKTQKKIAKFIIGKQKIKIDKFWSEENLEKVLFQIENISYKVVQGSQKNEKRKKRVTTENATEFQSNPFRGLIKSSSNSRIPSGRKGEMTNNL